MILLTGDTHRSEDIHKLGTSCFPVDCDRLTKEDYLIVLGDFGLVWSRPESKFYKEELYWQGWLADKPWTTLFVDGNHENHPMLYELPEVEKFGSKVGKVNDSIYHLKRGEVYEIEGQTFFTMGGAFSIDRNTKVKGVSWWEEEIPSTAEFEYGLKNLEAHGWKVDYILGHTCPYNIGRLYLKCITDAGNNILQKINMDDVGVSLTGEQLAYLSFDEEYFSGKLDGISKYFDTVVEYTQFKKFYFGHFHDSWCTKGERYIMLYEDIVFLDEIKPEWKSVWE